ncbi:hypothetical protein VB711_04430 [Cronbergia sp. UHCC 0137]|uniref:hypothetical protein n=1 Tax=Cronbergia sp. UHCC 0137 TaxID=3110239 RepID=UPI002B20033D|nr:hypothetical protein [Cronbergia sp. UHCC 0137]MEA5617088.1 hypothetical protein [Cronbergia sp. UHCC 0137]
MLTLEYEASKLIQELPKKSRIGLQDTNFYPVENSATGSFENLLCELNRNSIYITEKIELDWEYRTELKIDELRNNQKVIEEVIKNLKNFLSEKTRNKQTFNRKDKEIKKQLKLLVKNLENQNNAIIDLIESEEINVEIEELRSRPLDTSKIKRAKEILSLL